MIDFQQMTAAAKSQGLFRTFDATVLNGIVNSDDSIAVAIGHDPSQPIDFSDTLGAIESIIAMDNGFDGGAIFEWSSPNIWQSHTLFSQSCRGRHAIDFSYSMIREMFTHWGAEELWGATPVSNRAAHIFNRKIGAHYVGQGQHHSSGHVLHFRVFRDEWLEKHPLR